MKRSEIVEKEAVKLTLRMKCQCGKNAEILPNAGQNQVFLDKKGASLTGLGKLEGLR